MTKEEVIKRINQFLVDEFEVDSAMITPDAKLQETLELDSLDYVDLVVIIENNFGYKPTSEDFKSMATFNDFYELICNRINVA